MSSDDAPEGGDQIAAELLDASLAAARKESEGEPINLHVEKRTQARYTPVRWAGDRDQVDEIVRDDLGVPCMRGEMLGELVGSVRRIEFLRVGRQRPRQLLPPGEPTSLARGRGSDVMTSFHFVIGDRHRNP